MKQHKRYVSYLLRLWQESAGDPELWRASLETPRDGARLVFASLVDLFVFLENETLSSPPGPERSDDERRRPPALLE
jgi:hypothetical protein